MSNPAGIAAIQAVGLLHAQGYELLRVWVTANTDACLSCTVHLFNAGVPIPDVLNREVNHVALSYGYTLNANAIIGGKVYPDPDPIGNGLAHDGWSRPEQMAKYLLKNYSEFTRTWRGEDRGYVEWFRRLTRLADRSQLPVMQTQLSGRLDLALGAVMVQDYAPSQQVTLFASEH
ncbi:hypothetical protein LAJ19_03255 [Deinococcus taeanensis]|uniref:hypothetical protein n=1 Tax=Deinococcus taeanensis TaxID=2737050 RepID=UPI001CDBA85C|nr:hypothetical protein [Deinococcus taeanensis]UBV43248.1 hypothetical protein LAJ19_03255 [Deinococcus taeanensis]